MKRIQSKITFMIAGVLIIAAGAVITFFCVPGSKTRTEFARTVADLTASTNHPESVFAEEDIAGLPAPVQKYFRYCGYIGTLKMSYIRIDYQDVDFVFSGKKPIKIDYTQYDFADQPNRVAYIDSSMYGIPFEGIDTFQNGVGCMKGVIAKLFDLFCQTGDVMDQSSQATFLSEILLFPTAALQEYIEWEAVDDLHAKAAMSYCGRTVSGIFTFDQSGAVLSFDTGDRSVVASNGESELVKWSVYFEKYSETDGIRKPTVFKAVWHYGDGDLVYFDGTGSIIADS